MTKEYSIQIPGWVILTGLGIISYTAIMLSNNKTRRHAVTEAMKLAATNKNIKSLAVNGSTIKGDLDDA